MKKKYYLCQVVNNKSYNKSYKNSFLNFIRNSKYKKIYNLNLDDKKSYDKIVELCKKKKIDFLFFTEFKIKYLIKIIKIKKSARKIFYLLNHSVFYYRNYKFKNNFLSNFKKFEEKLNFYIYKIFQTIGLLPEVDLIFYSSKLYIKKKNQKKIISQYNLPINIYAYKKAIRINSYIGEYFINNKIKIKNENIIFLDGCFNHNDRSIYCQKASDQEEKKYYMLINIILKKLSILNNSKSLFLAHPQTKINKIKKYLKDVKIIKNRTYDEILKASHVIFHESSSVNLAILSDKKIFSLHSPLLGSWANYRTKEISSNLKCPSYMLEKIYDFNNRNLLKILKKPNIKNNKYIKNNLINMYQGNNKRKLAKYKLENNKIFNKYLFHEN